MRCPSCEKFVSYNTEVGPEENDEAVFDGMVLTAAYRRVLACGECGEELKETVFEFEVTEFEWKMPDNGGERPATEEEIELCLGDRALDMVDVEAESTTEVLKGKTMYGVKLTATIKCQCGMSADVKVSDSASASSMDDLV